MSAYLKVIGSGGAPTANPSTTPMPTSLAPARLTESPRGLRHPLCRQREEYLRYRPCHKQR